MARPLRIEYPGAWYHAMNRGLNQSDIYLSKSDYELFLKVLKESCYLFHVSVSAYCLMGNHYHLLLCTPEGNLGRFMRHLNGVYTQRHNRKYKKDGPLFRGRYKAILVQEEDYLLGVMRYIHRNPLKANIVKELSKYPWSSHKAYEKGKSKESWLNIDDLLGSFSEKRRIANKMYKEFIDQKIDTEIDKFYFKPQQSSILGEDSFIKMIRERFVYPDKEDKIEIKEKIEMQGEGRIEIINLEIMKYFGINEENIYSSKRGEVNVPRSMAILLSREFSGFKFPEIAKRYKIGNYRTVGTICYRFNEKLKSNKKLSKQYRKIKSICSQEWT